MGVLRAEPARLGSASRAVGSAWKAFDWQLAVYALMLMTFGLVMGYSNSVHDGTSPFSWGTTFTRGLMWAAMAIVAFTLATAFDYKWLKTFAWPLYARGCYLYYEIEIGNSRSTPRDTGAAVCISRYDLTARQLTK